MRRSRSMFELKDLRLRAEYALVRSAAALLRLLPIDVGAAIVGSVVAWIAPWTALHRRALANLAAAFPDWSEAERKRVAAAMWRNTGRTIAETLLLDRIVSDPSRLEIEGRDAVERRPARTRREYRRHAPYGKLGDRRHCRRHLRRQARRRLSLAAKSLSRPISARDAKPFLSRGPSCQSDDARRRADRVRGASPPSIFCGTEDIWASCATRSTTPALSPCLSSASRRSSPPRPPCLPAASARGSGSGAAFVAITVHGS